MTSLKIRAVQAAIASIALVGFGAFFVGTASAATVTSFPTVNAANQASVAISGTCDSAILTPITITVTGIATISSTVSCDVTNTWSTTLDLTSLTDGALAATADDGVTPPVPVSATKDTTPPPAPSILTNPPPISNTNSYSFTFDDSEAGVTFLCRIGNAAPFSPCTSPFAGGTLPGSREFDVKAVDSALNQSTATPYPWTINNVPQTINVTQPAPASVAYGDTFVVTATTSDPINNSGNDVVITTPVGNCLVTAGGGNSATITAINVGTCHVYFNLAGNGDYADATQVDELVTVTVRHITVTANDAGKVVGGSDPALTYTITLGTLASGDTLSGALSRDAGEAIGTYTITKGTLAVAPDSDYDLGFVPGTFTISDAPPAPPANFGGGNGPIVGGGGGGGGGSPAVALPNNGGAPGGTTGGQVLGASTSTVTTDTSTTGTPATTYNFSTNLGRGSRGEDVIELQGILIAQGYLSISAPTGYFGPLTFAAVKEYQAAKGIAQTGFVGPLTRAALNG